MDVDETEIFESGLFEGCGSLAFGHMEVIVDSAASSSDQELTYLYK